jgi:hypothetical protein
VEHLAGAAKPVEESDLSTAAVHRENGSGNRGKAVFPDVHTPYCYYELF